MVNLVSDIELALKVPAFRKLDISKRGDGSFGVTYFGLASSALIVDLLR